MPKWKDEYSLDIPQIDSQHKEVFKIIEMIYLLKESSTLKEDMRTVLFELSNYMNVHFKDEEEYMKSIGYPYLKEHMKEHEEIIIGFRKMMTKTKSLELLSSYLEEWISSVFLKHMTHDDMKIKQYYLSIRAAKQESSSMEEDLIYL